jgi:hypothetical protein
MTHSSNRLAIVRSEADYALAARMLLRLRKGADVRPARVARARQDLRNSLLDDAARLDWAMDILLDELIKEDQQPEREFIADPDAISGRASF